MPALPRFFDYHFHPVGQGLFASGYLRSEHRSTPDFQWVYDCGTTSEAKYVRAGLRDVKKLSRGRQRLDILTLSHFDRDHISGVCDLLRKYSVGTLLLPYMPLWQRLVIGFEEGVPPDSKLIRFFVSPATYLSRVPGANIERILYVLPSEGGNNEGVPEPESRNPSGNKEPKWEPDIDRFEADPLESEQLAERDPASLAPRKSPVIVEYLRARGAIRIGGFWEFVPYNDAAYSKNATANFLSIIDGQQQRLLGRSAERERALTEIKNVYDQYFGGSSRQRNIISLFLYCGPIYRSWREVTLGLANPDRRNGAYAGLRYRLHTEPTADGRASVLYTGDGYLDTPQRLQSLETHLGPRKNRIGAFQVMHHGAEGNWHEGVGPAFSPAFSVFSSDPRNKKLRHPHLPVLEDFRKFRPYQVDKQSGVAAVGTLLPQAVGQMAPLPGAGPAVGKVRTRTNRPKEAAEKNVTVRK
jgi:hypothetical protein